MDDGRIRVYFGRRRKVVSAEVLVRIARERVPSEVRVRDNLESKMEYGNHKSATKYGGEKLRKDDGRDHGQGYRVPSDASAGGTESADITRWGSDV